MKFSIIIPTFNRNDLLNRCLLHLIPEFQTTICPYEVIVSDDSIDDNAKELILKNFPWVKYISGPKTGPASNRNNGAKYAMGEWIIFLDDDCIPGKDWISSYEIAKKINPKFLVLEGKTIADRERKRFDEEAPVNLEGDNLWSCNFAIQKELFFSLSGFDEGFPYAAMEDTDFQCRVKFKNQILFVPNALVIHPWRLKKPFKNINKHLSSHKYFLNKNGPARNLQFKLKRAKIFLTCSYYDFFILMKYSMKGWTSYLEDCLSNFCMIFI